MRRSVYFRPDYERLMVSGVKGPAKRLLNTLCRKKTGRNPLRNLIDIWHIIGDIVRIWRNMDRLPDPTVDNVGQYNSAILVRIADYWFGCERLPYLHKPLRKLAKLLIIVYDTHFYRPFIDVWVRELRASSWRAMGPLQPDPQYWEESAAERPYSEPLRIEDKGGYFVASRFGPEDLAEARGLLRV